MENSRKSTTDASYFYYCAIENFRNSNYAAAIRECSKAIGLAPQFSQAYGLRGDAYLQQGNLEDAILDYTEAIRLKPHYPIAYCARGSAYLELANYEYAIRDCNNAILLDPQLSWAYTIRGEAQKKSGTRNRRSWILNN
ncbi:MAG: tetratricopeptide repeat protein [Anaerolineaceae bacterium]